MKELTIEILNKLMNKIVIELNEIELKNKNNSKIKRYDFDFENMILFGEFENGHKFRKKINLNKKRK